MSKLEQPTASSGADTETATGRSSSWRSGWRRAAVIVGGVLLAILVVVGTIRLVHRGEVLPGVSVATVDVGGLDREATRERLATLVSERREETITFTHEEEEFVLTPGDDTYGADLEAAVDAAYAVGRTGDPFTSSWSHVVARFGREVTVELADDLQRGEVQAWVVDVADQVDTESFPGSVSADPDTLQVTSQPPAPGVQVLTEEAVDRAVGAIREAGSESFELPTETIEPPVGPADVEQVAAQAREALEGPLTLTAEHGATVTFSPAELAPLVAGEVVGSGDEATFELRAPSEAVGAAFEPHLDALNVEPVDATFEVMGGLTTFDDQSDVTWEPKPAELRVVPGENGYTFDAERAADQLSQLMATATREADLDLVVEEPDITSDEAESLGVTDLIGTFTTYHACCANRVANIHRMADIVRGAVLEPGDEFSVNEHVGERTRAKGFVADGTIVRGEYVDEVGGGVSQFATTMYNASFFAGIEILEHKAHSYYISRYPMGREGTLYYPSVDLRIRNDTDKGLFIHTSYTGTSITVSLFGDNGGRQVSAIHGEPHNYRSSRTIYRDNPNLPRGSERVVQSGGTGFDVVVTRVIDTGGDEERERIFTRYEAPLRIVERGTGEPRPEPSPTPTEDGSPQGGGGDGGGSDGGGNGGGSDSGGGG
ncbi:MAG: VanW family protein [Actinobacteria bacterium]|nr:VanW family protein [Actinomycetota bacterium]